MAILLVVAYHAGVGIVGGGYVGVDVFFVISGFLITSHLFREVRDRGRISFAAFYARRIARLLPAAALVVVATLAAAWHWMPPLLAQRVSHDGLASALYAINFRLAAQGTNYQAALEAPSPFQHFWSLAVEEQYYLVWPVLLYLLLAAPGNAAKPAARGWLAFRRRRPALAAAAALAALGAVSFAVCVWQTRTAQPWAYFGIQARAWELASGALAALAAGWLARLRPALAAGLTWLGLAAVVASALVFTERTPFPGYAAALPVAGALAIVAGGCAAPRYGAVRLLGLPPMQRIGRLSYGWYLWHWPVLLLAPYALGSEPGLAVRIGLMGLALGLAAASLHLVENPIRFRPRLRTSPRRGLALGAALTSVAAAPALISARTAVDLTGTGSATDTAAVLSRPRSTAHQELASLLRSSASATAVPANLNPRLEDAIDEGPPKGECIVVGEVTSIEPAVSAGCDRLGDPSSPTTVVLIGDSHAHQWLPALEQVAKEEHWRLVVYAKHGCPLADALVVKPGTTSQRYDECTAWRKDALAAIAALHPTMVVGASLMRGGTPLDRSGDADEAWLQAWMETLRTLQRSATTVKLLEDTPYPGRNVPECLSGHMFDATACGLDEDEAVNHPEQRRRLHEAATRAGIGTVDPTGWFCVDGTCPAIVGNTVVYRDSSHITPEYAAVLAPFLKPALALP
ncbi:MAG: acyltransferase [Micromonosporaceae bacterium]|nr:acyltransferase [Micromonosporaceae bacterium]